MKSLFKTNVHCIQSGSPLRQAKELMKEKRIRHLPIINENDEIISLISKHDFTDIDRFQDLPVDLFASRPVITVPQETPLRNVALTMLEKKISCILLIDHELRLMGIITTDDLLLHLTELLNFESTKIENESSSVDLLITAGEFFRRLSNIGI